MKMRTAGLLKPFQNLFSKLPKYFIESSQYKSRNKESCQYKYYYNLECQVCINELSQIFDVISLLIESG